MHNNSIKIMLIEYNPADARLIYKMLKDQNYLFQIETFKNLKDGLKNLSDKYSIILLDLMLPDSSGFKTFIKTYNKASGLPIIVLSGCNYENLAYKILSEGHKIF